MRRQLIRALLGPDRFDELKEFRIRSKTHPRFSMALARAGATAALRQVDLTRPSTWEFSGFSQNGEDGIIDVLCNQLRRADRYFIEIGSSSGIENNSAWLALARRYGGLMIDGDPSKIAEARIAYRTLNWAIDFEAVLVNRRTIGEVERHAAMRNPDLMSLDIDGIDYYVALELLERFRPKIFVVEYNSVFGPDRAVTVPYRDEFNRRREHPTGYYYGMSITAARRLFARFKYRFLTVEQNGLNAFFVDPATFDVAFLDAIRGESYRENIVHRRESRSGWQEQFAQIAHLPLVEVPDAESTSARSAGREALAV